MTTRARVLLITSVLWFLLGVAAALYHLDVQSSVGEGAVIWPAVLLYALGSGFGANDVRSGLLWDSAHGPPFLTGIGVALVYFLPAALGLLWYARLVVRARPAA
jgi:hypothetical protein